MPHPTLDQIAKAGAKDRSDLLLNAVTASDCIDAIHIASALKVAMSSIQYSILMN